MIAWEGWEPLSSAVPKKGSGLEIQGVFQAIGSYMGFSWYCIYGHAPIEDVGSMFGRFSVAMF